MSCLTQLFTEAEADNLRDAIETLSEKDEADGNETPVSFELAGRGARGTGNTGPTSQRPWKAYCALHRPNRKTQPQRAVLELELLDEYPIPVRPASKAPPIFRSAFDDPDSPSNQADDKRPGMPTDATIQPSEEDSFESTVSLVQPLKEMVRLKKQRARQKAQGITTGKEKNNARHGELHVVQLLSQVDEQLQKAEDLPTFLKVSHVFVKY